MGIEYVRQMTPAEHREREREIVCASMRAGNDLEGLGQYHDLPYLFSPDELKALEQESQEVQEAKAERTRAREAAGKLRRMTDRVLKEWDDEEAATRRAKATKEAKKRLGLS